MPPELAAILTIVFIAALIRHEKIIGRSLPKSLWIPLVWLMIISSRFPGEWLYPEVSIELTDGSPIDRVFFMFMLFLGLIVLFRRKLDWFKIIRDNRWIILFFLYCGVSILWSDFAFTGFKRWIKDVGNLVMVLVVLTVDDPEEVVDSFLRHYMYFLVPLSVLLIRYYPRFGKAYDPWTGGIQYTGVGVNKNYLGFLCLISGLFLIWSHLTRKKRHLESSKYDPAIKFIFTIMLLWLLIKANSATATGCLLVGSLVLLFLQVATSSGKVRYLGVTWMAGLVLIALLQVTVDVFGLIVGILGRDSTLTDRIPLWTDILNIDFNPFFGTGYDTFWLGSRLSELWMARWWQPNQAHNGYIEMYINLGIVGLCLLFVLLYITFKKNRNDMLDGLYFGSFGIAFLSAVLLYNITEAAFKGLHPIWFIFILTAIVGYRGGSKNKVNKTSKN